MDYYTSWTISSIAKLATAALEKTGKAGGFVITAIVVGGCYLGYRKMRKLEDRVSQLEWQVKFGGK